MKFISYQKPKKKKGKEKKLCNGERWLTSTRKNSLHLTLFLPGFQINPAFIWSIAG